uniref:Putative ovule protein n=1 Tax=Solanum chacoense TaxID=4108 RepID=A0A0V0GR75_SOLCH
MISPSCLELFVSNLCIKLISCSRCKYLAPYCPSLSTRGEASKEGNPLHEKNYTVTNKKKLGLIYN